MSGVLFWLVISMARGGVATIPYLSQEKCEAARTIAAAQYSVRDYPIVFCIPGDVTPPVLEIKGLTKDKGE